MDWEVNYSYHWGAVEGDGVYTATGIEANHTLEGERLALARIKQDIAKKLYEESKVVLYEPGTDIPIEFGGGSFHKGLPRGQLGGHASLNMDGNFILDVYEKGEPR